MRTGFLPLRGLICCMVVCLAAQLGGCVTKSVEPDTSAKIRPTAMTIVSSFRSKARYYPGSRFALAAEPAPLHSDNRVSGDAMSALIEEAIINSLQQMGYQYSNSTEAVDFLVAYQLAMPVQQGKGHTHHAPAHTSATPIHSSPRPAIRSPSTVMRVGS